MPIARLFLSARERHSSGVRNLRQPWGNSCSPRIHYPEIRFLNSLFCTLPIEFRGRASTKNTCFGTL